MTIIRSVEELNALYGEAGEASLVKVTARLTPDYARMIEASPFAALATVGPRWARLFAARRRRLRGQDC